MTENIQESYVVTEALSAEKAGEVARVLGELGVTTELRVVPHEMTVGVDEFNLANPIDHGDVSILFERIAGLVRRMKRRGDVVPIEVVESDSRGGSPELRADIPEAESWLRWIHAPVEARLLGRVLERRQRLAKRPIDRQAISTNGGR